MKRLHSIIMGVGLISVSVLPCYFCDDSSIEQDIALFDFSPLTRNIASGDETEELSKLPFIAISLGKNCWVSTAMNKLKVRIRSFPFDWNVTPLNALYNLIANHFDGFLDLNNLCIKLGGPGLYNKHYDCWLAHDFNKPLWKNNPKGTVFTENCDEMQHYETICAYYNRRIERFYTVFTLGVPLYLFRRDISSHEAQQLYNFLKKQFPNAPFTLVCIEDEPKHYEPINNWKRLPHIKHFRLRSPDVSRAEKEWRAMFIQLGMLTQD